MKNTRAKISLAIVTVMLLGLAIQSLDVSATVPGSNEPVSVNTSGGVANGSDDYSSISQDGRYIAFASTSKDLISPALSSSGLQVFLRDRLTDSTQLISQSTSGGGGNGNSYQTSISTDGRFVSFVSYASNLVSGDTNNYSDVFIRDTKLNTTTIVSKNSSGVIGNNYSTDADVSADSKFVVFVSSATNLVTGAAPQYGNQTYLKNMTTNVITRISQSASGNPANATTSYPDISCEGRIVTFQSVASNLVSGDTNSPSRQRIYIVDLMSSLPYPNYITGSATHSTEVPSISCNGNYLTFVTAASNIGSGDTNGKEDIYKYDRINDSFELISVDSSENLSNGDSGSPSVSNDGKYIVFQSSASNLTTGDSNGSDDIFLRNVQSGTTELITRAASGTISNSWSFGPNISSDGRYVSYTSNSNNLVGSFSNTTPMVFTSQTGSTNDY